MMAHQLDDKERVREATDIVRLIESHLALRPKGREYVGLCPFHDDHNPSLTVVPSKQIFSCFVCGAAGDAFSFVQMYHKMEFREALEYLAERANITLTRRSPAGEEPGHGVEKRVSRSDLVRANALACEFYRKMLARQDTGAAARALIGRRGIAPEMVERFTLGAAPDRWDGLAVTVRNKGLDTAPYVELGLLRERERGGGHYDGLRNRLIFPIRDQIGRVVGFGGRKLDEADEPKYLNSPESRLFNKSSMLYGVHEAARAIQAERTAILTEGYTDVIACHQAGFANVVATLGTALTRGHAQLLRRLCDTIVLLFDGDEAGMRAADRATEVFFAEPVDVKIATLGSVTEAKDPDELLSLPEGPGLFRRMIDGAPDLLEFRFGRVRQRLAGSGVSALTRGIEEELGRLAELGLADVAPLRRRLVMRRLSQIAGVDERTMIAAMPSGRRGDVRRAGTSPARQRAGSSPLEHLLGCVLCDGSLWSAMDETDRERIRAYGSGVVSQVGDAIGSVAESGRSVELTSVLGELEDLDARALAVSLAQRIEMDTDGEAARVRTYWSQCLERFRRESAGAVRAESPLEEIIRRRERGDADPTRLPRPSVHPPVVGQGPSGGKVGVRGDKDG